MLHRFVCAMIILAGICQAQQSGQAASKTASKSSAKTTAAPAPKTAPNSTTVPPDAVQIEPGLWRHTDKDGKVWMYRRTPFAISKYEPEAESSADVALDIVAADDGDSVRFERKTPFGVSRWTRKKTELTEDEAAAWKRATSSSSKTGANVNAAKPAVKE